MPDKKEYEAGETFDPTGMKVVAKLANGLIQDVTKYVTYSKEPLTKEDLEIEISYEYVMYNDKEKKKRYTCGLYTDFKYRSGGNRSSEKC